jgi:hypothetical protein
MFHACVLGVLFSLIWLESHYKFWVCASFTQGIISVRFSLKVLFSVNRRRNFWKLSKNAVFDRFFDVFQANSRGNWVYKSVLLNRNRLGGSKFGNRLPCSSKSDQKSLCSCLVQKGKKWRFVWFWMFCQWIFRFFVIFLGFWPRDQGTTETFLIGTDRNLMANNWSIIDPIIGQ